MISESKSAKPKSVKHNSFIVYHRHKFTMTVIGDYRHLTASNQWIISQYNITVFKLLNVLKLILHAVLINMWSPALTLNSSLSLCLYHCSVSVQCVTLCVPTICYNQPWILQRPRHFKRLIYPMDVDMHGRSHVCQRCSLCAFTVGPLIYN